MLEMKLKSKAVLTEFQNQMFMVFVFREGAYFTRSVLKDFSNKISE